MAKKSDIIIVDARKYNKLKHDIIRTKRILDYLVNELIDSIEVDNDK